MVRFKPQNVGPRELPRLEFQFHDGSIQATGLSVGGDVWTLFQFHDGSIQAATASLSDKRVSMVSIPRWFDSSDRPVRRRRRMDLCFNSTMVRFKRAFPPSAKAFFKVSIPRWFDSSDQSPATRRASGVFQFHDGSIQAVMALA